MNPYAITFTGTFFDTGDTFEFYRTASSTTVSCSNYGYGGIPTTVTADCDFTGAPITTVGTEYDARSISASSGNIGTLPTVMTVISGPVISSVSPTLQATSTFNLTVTGVSMPPATPGSFVGTEDVRLIRTAQSDIVCSAVSGGGTSVVVSCPASGADTTGPYDVKVTDALSLTDTLTSAIQFYTPWSTPVNGGGFSPSGSDYGIFAHDGVPYFTVQAFDEVEKIWGSSSSVPSTIPAAAGKDAKFNSTKVRAVVSTASNANALWAYEFNKATGVIGSHSNPSSGAQSMDVNAIDIASNDNTLAVATSSGDYFYVYDIDVGAAIGSFWTSTLANTSTKPTGTCNDIDYHPNLTYIAVGCDSSPYLFVYNFDNATPAIGSKLTNPSSLPSGAVNGVKFSPDGTQIAIATDTTPFVEVYEFNGGVIGDKASSPADLPNGIGNDVDWLNYNVTGLTNLAVAHAITPFVSIYNFTTDAAAAGTFGVRIDVPGTPPTGTGNTVGFHPNDDVVFVGHASSPYVTSYNFTGVNDDDYRVYRYMANFDTSYLPDDASISAATLSIYGDSVNGSGWQLLFEDGTPSSEPLVVGDYDYSNYSTQLTATGHTPTTGWNDVTLNAAGMSAISKTGVTQILIRHEDDIGNTAPTVVETMDIEVGSATAFPEDCITDTTWGVINASSLYNQCNSPNVPTLKITYTSTTNPIADITATFTNTTTANTDGTHSIGVLNKGPVTVLKVDGAANDQIMLDYGRVFTDNANDWSFLKSTNPNKPFKFSKQLLMQKDGSTVLWYELDTLPGAQMIDRSRTSEGGSDDETTTLMSFPPDSTLLDISVLSALSSSAAAPSLTDDPETADIISVNADDLTGGINSNSEVPMGSWFTFIEGQGGMPSGTIATMLALIGTMFAAILAYRSFSSISATFIAVSYTHLTLPTNREV